MVNNQGFIVLVDISGYTKFIRMHKMRKIPFFGKKFGNNTLEHAETVISDLLEKIIENLDDTLIVNKLQGDAALFYSVPEDPKEYSERLIEKLKDCFELFNNRLNELLFCKTCVCDPCQQLTNLKLKSFVHYGEFLIKRVSRFEEIAGEDVIIAHRLMKNSINSSEYILLTDNVAQLKDLSYLGKLDQRKEKCEGLDDVPISVYYPDPSAYENQEQSQASFFQKARTMNRFFKNVKTRKALEEQYAPQAT